MKIAEIIEYLDSVIPSTFSQPWDNDGVMVFADRKSETSRVVVALDATSVVIRQAAEWGAGLIVTHHPLIFDGLSSVDCADSVGKRVISCVQNNIALVSYHTRLDDCVGGVNDCLAKVLGLENTEILSRDGGKFGYLEKDTSFEQYLQWAVEKFSDSKIQWVKSAHKVKKIAICSGSCKESMLYDALKADCDTFITGEAKHSCLISAKELGLNMLTISHHETENVVLEFLANLIKKQFDLEVKTIPFNTKDEYGI